MADRLRPGYTREQNARGGSTPAARDQWFGHCDDCGARAAPGSGEVALCRTCARLRDRAGRAEAAGLLTFGGGDPVFDAIARGGGPIGRPYEWPHPLEADPVPNPWRDWVWDETPPGE